MITTRDLSSLGSPVGTWQVKNKPWGRGLELKEQVINEVKQPVGALREMEQKAKETETVTPDGWGKKEEKRLAMTLKRYYVV